MNWPPAYFKENLRHTIVRSTCISATCARSWRVSLPFRRSAELVISLCREKAGRNEIGLCQDSAVVLWHVARVPAGVLDGFAVRRVSGGGQRRPLRPLRRLDATGCD